jgi:hypothetical protein
MIMGVWGALIPFIGPAFDFGFGGSQTWDWTAARFWLEVLPGIAAFVGGLMLAGSANRGTTMLGAWLGIAAGTWFIIGPTLATPWHLGDLGFPMGSAGRQATTWLLFFYGLGAAILYFASTAQGRLSVRSLRDIEHAQMYVQRRMLAREARSGAGGGILGGRRRQSEPEPVAAGRTDRDESAAVAPTGRTGRIRRSERVDQTAQRDAYPTEATRPTAADRTESPRVNRVEDRDGRTASTNTAAPASTASTNADSDVYPSDAAQADGAASGRHEARSEGLGGRIGRTLARHGIGSKH